MLMVTKAGHWAADDLDLLPDDGNRYEVVDGELFVTPAPSLAHQAVAEAFHSRLRDFVKAHRIGRAFFAPGDVHIDNKNRVQPDLFVVPRTAAGRPKEWRDAPKPMVVVEVLSDSTARRDLGSKRELYLRAGIAEYWIVDHESRSVRVVRQGEPEIVMHDRIEWHPAGATETLVIDLPALFREALDED
jgi:Uma2 family endonuclease